MSGGRRQHKGPRPDTRPRPRSVAFPAPRPAARLTGGPLAGCVVHVEHHIADAGTMPVKGGRYVRIDADLWSFERDHVSKPA